MKERNKRDKNQGFFQCNFFPKNRKGVSPVIATVLLIGLVIALGSVVFVWFQSFTQEAVTKFEGENIELTCGDVDFRADYSPNGILGISNLGNVPIFSFNVKIDSGAGAYTTEEIENLVGNWPKIGLRASGVFSGNIAGSVSGSTTQIILIPILRGSVGSGDEKSFTCGDQHGQVISI